MTDTILLYLIAAGLFVLSAVKDREKTKKAFARGLKSFEGILPQLLAVLVFLAIGLALFDAGTISRYLGADSGWLGVALAALIGSVTLIPAFVAFPAAGELLHNGAGVLQMATFVSTLMMVGIVTDHPGLRLRMQLGHQAGYVRPPNSHLRQGSPSGLSRG